MHTWLDVWHMALAIVARQPPFAAIMIATGAVFVVVMTLEGMRSSLRAIWQAHISAPAAPHADLPPEPVTLAMPAAAAPPSRSFSARVAAATQRRPKPLTLSPRQFRSPRPVIRRRTVLLSALPENPAPAPAALMEAL